MSDVEWRECPDLPGYWVSSDGQVRGASGRLRKQQTNTQRGGYRQLGIRGPDGRSRMVKVHRLVCRAFHGPPPSPKHEVAHGDGDPGNNAASNLRWATRSENHRDKHRHGTAAAGERSSSARLTETQVKSIRARHVAGETQAGIARDLGVGIHLIHQVVRRISWKHVP